MNQNKRENLTNFFKIGDIYLPILEGKNPDSGSLIHLYFSCCDKMTLVHSVLFKFNMNISRIVGIFEISYFEIQKIKIKLFFGEFFLFTNTLSLINSVIIRRRNKNNRLEAKYAKIRSLPDTFNFLNFQTVTQILVEVWILNPAFSTLQKLEHTCSLFMYAQQICIKLYYLSGTILRARFLTRTLFYAHALLLFSFQNEWQ